MRIVPVKHLVFVAIAEAVALVTTVLRFTFSNGAIDLDVTAHLAWFIVCGMLAASSVAFLVVRSIGFAERERAGEDVSDLRRSTLGVSLSLVVGALLLAIVGPGPFERLLGR